MSADAAFEFKSDVDLQTLIHETSSLWKGDGCFVDIYICPDYAIDRIFCFLSYFYGYPDEEDMLRDVVNYLLKVASNKQIYYYRCSDFAPLQDDIRPTPEIKIDDLFQKEFRPSLQASFEQKYLIRSVATGIHSTN